MCACVVRATLYWSSGAIPYGGTKEKAHLNDVLFSFQINFGNRTGGKTENPMNCAPYSNSAHFINAKEFWRLHFVG